MPELVITEANADQFGRAGQQIRFAGHVRRLSCRPREHRYGAQPGAIPVQALGVSPIPRSEWDARIAVNDRDRAWAYDRMAAASVPVKDQDGLGYCWAYAATQCLEAARLVQGHPYVELCPESAGGQVTNWRDRGGTMSDSLRAISEYGACAVSLVTEPHKLRPSAWQEGWKDDALTRRVTEWIDLEEAGKQFDWCVTCALLGLPYWAGFGWWGHAVVGGLKVRKQGSGYQVMYRNSWGPSYGEDGYFWFTEDRKGVPDIGIFAPAVARASEG